MQTWKGRSIAGGIGEGEALVTGQGLCFMGGIDINTGKVAEVGHEIFQQSIKDKVLVLHSHKGSASGMWAMYHLKLKGLGPKAIIIPRADAVIIAAAIMAQIPTVDSLEIDPLTTLRTGDRLRVNGDKATVDRL